MYSCTECGWNCFATYCFDCNRPDKRAERSKWEQMAPAQILTIDEIEKIKKDAVEMFYSKDKAEQEKEPELMTLAEAWENADIGERIEHPTEASFIKDEMPPPFELSYRSAVDRNWQIIRAEPVVLSAEDVYDQNSHKTLNDLDVERDDFIKIWEVADKNGQRRRDGDYQELLNIISEGIGHYFSKSQPLDVQGFMHELSEAINNLKPLEGRWQE